MVNEWTTHELRNKLCVTYEKEIASHKVHLMKRLFKLQMKDGGSISLHLNEFNIIFSQLQAQKLNFDAAMKAIFLLCSLSSSWDTFRTIISNFALVGVLNLDDVVGSLLVEEIKKMSMDHGK